MDIWMSFQGFAGVLPHGFQRSCVYIAAVGFPSEALVVDDCASSCCIRLVVNLRAGAF